MDVETYCYAVVHDERNPTPYFICSLENNRLDRETMDHIGLEVMARGFIVDWEEIEVTILVGGDPDEEPPPEFNSENIIGELIIYDQRTVTYIDPMTGEHVETYYD